ncbi:MAG TPA: T9SS type A sorting domain-containing protein, partial [Candidatus Krumholzibacteria bacterium]|nr:T9SS type A sorting domain-containing protein [Candidatus Krumholzibacteria bacterium]
LVWCPAPPSANGATDDAGITQFNLPLAAGGHAQQLQVCLDGIPIGGITSPDLAFLKVRCVDLDRDLNVGLLDFVVFTSDLASSTNGPDVDFNLDGGSRSSDDGLILMSAMNSDVNCPSSPPNIGPAQGELGVYFDAAGTQTVGNVVPGATFDLYVCAKGMTEGYPKRAFEFALPALDDPTIEVLGVSYLFERPLVDTETAANESRFTIFHSSSSAPLPDADEIPLFRATLRLRSSVQGLQFRPTALTHSSFGSSNTPGWVGGDPDIVSHPFASVTSATLNPFPGEVYAGLVTEALDAATLAETVGALELGGLNSAIGGMNIDLMGLGGNFYKVGTVGVDGAGIVFANSMPTANLPDGAGLNWSFDDPNGNSLVTLSSMTSSGTMTHQTDMSALGSPTLSLNFTQNDQTVYSQSGYNGSWQCDEGLPAILGLFYIGGELNLLYDWGKDVTVSIGGQDYVGDQLILTSETGATVPRGLFAKIHLTANDIPTIQIASFGIQRFDQIYRDLQNGYYVNTNASLEVIRSDWSTPASFLVERLDGQPVMLNFPGPDMTTEPDGAVDVLFQGNNTNGEVKWSLHNGPTVQLETDFSGIGASGWTAQGLVGGIKQWEYGGSTPELATLERWPLRPSMTGTGVSAEWNSPSVVSEPGGTSHTAVSALQVDAVQPTQALPDGSRAQVSFSKMHELVLTEQQFSTANPPTTRRVAGLLAAYPNPFNPSTKIGMYLATPGHVTLEIFAVRGRRICRLVDGPMPAGKSTVEWDGRDMRGESLASGIYFAHLVTSTGNYSEKLALVR